MQVHPDFDLITIKRKSDGKTFTVGESIIARTGDYGQEQAKIKGFRYNPTGNTVKLVVDVLTVQGVFKQSIPIENLR